MSQNWKGKTILSLNGGEREFEEEFVFIDPVDPSRNVAAALSKEKLEFFKLASKEFLKNPKIEFFFPNPPPSLSKEELKAKLKNFVGIYFKKPKLPDDIIYPQLKKAALNLENLLKQYDFEVKSILQVIGEYIKNRKIILDPSRNQKIVTLHDPCNLVRFGGIIEEQRYILRNSVTNFVEMEPNREKNYCCGGGRGQLAMTRFAERRLKVGKIKAEQIKKTGAEIVATPCHNCIDQLNELNKYYKLGVEIKTICEIVADALILK